MSTTLPHAPRTSLVETTIALIREKIEGGAWAVGSKIPTEAELASMLQVGRNTVREAVRVLSHAQVLEVRQGDGTYVRLNMDPAETMRRISRSGLRDHFELRAMLETESARLAALRHTPQELAELHALLEARNAQRAHGKHEAFVAADLAFHGKITLMAHNAALDELYRYVTAAAAAAMRQAIAEEDIPEPDGIAHLKIIEAITARDAGAAAEAARAVIAPVVAALERLAIQQAS